MMPRVAVGLNWLGRQARYILAIGCVAAFFMPSLSAFLRPALPFFVSMVLASAVARLDVGDIARRILTPERLKITLGVTILALPLTALIYKVLGMMVGLGSSTVAFLVLLAAAPPIASAAGLCFLLGYNARLALETTLVSTVLTPVIGPLIVTTLLPDLAPVSGLDLAMRLGLMVAGGIVMGVLIRAVVGPTRITRNKLLFDGLAAIVMLLFVFPLFDGVRATMLADPGQALFVFCLAVAFNLGVTLLGKVILAARYAPADAGALGLMWGNRTVAIYLAALPYDPVFSLFVALYQFPMYFTPLILAALGHRVEQEPSLDT